MPPGVSNVITSLASTPEIGIVLMTSPIGMKVPSRTALKSENFPYSNPLPLSRRSHWNLEEMRLLLFSAIVLI